MSKATMRDARKKIAYSFKLIAYGIKYLFLNLNYFRLACSETVLYSFVADKMSYLDKREFIEKARYINVSSSSVDNIETEGAGGTRDI